MKLIFCDGTHGKAERTIMAVVQRVHIAVLKGQFAPISTIAPNTRPIVASAASKEQITVIEVAIARSREEKGLVA